MNRPDLIPFAFAVVSLAFAVVALVCSILVCRYLWRETHRKDGD